MARIPICRHHQQNISYTPTAPSGAAQTRKMLAHQLSGKRRPIPPSPDATPPFTLLTPEDNTPPTKQPTHSITDYLISQSSQQQPPSQPIRHQQPLHRANHKPTITHFLTPQMSNQQPAIKRTYLQALIDKATEEHNHQPQAQPRQKPHISTEPAVTLLHTHSADRPLQSHDIQLHYCQHMEKS